MHCPKHFTHTHTHTHSSICWVLLLYQLRKLKPKEINNLLKVLWLIGFGQSLDDWKWPILCNSCIICYCGDIPYLDVQFLVNEQLSWFKFLAVMNNVCRKSFKIHNFTYEYLWVMIFYKLKFWGKMYMDFHLDRMCQLPFDDVPTMFLAGLSFNS